MAEGFDEPSRSGLNAIPASAGDLAGLSIGPERNVNSAGKPRVKGDAPRPAAFFIDYPGRRLKAYRVPPDAPLSAIMARWGLSKAGAWKARKRGYVVPDFRKRKPRVCRATAADAHYFYALAWGVLNTDFRGAVLRRWRADAVSEAVADMLGTGRTLNDAPTAFFRTIAKRAIARFARKYRKIKCYEAL